MRLYPRRKDDAYDGPHLLTERSYSAADEVKPVAMPTGVRLWHFAEARQWAKEQLDRFAAMGKRRSRRADVRAETVKRIADEDDAAIKRQTQTVVAAEKSYAQTKSALGAHGNRGAHAVATYYFTLVLFLGGDVAGVAGASIDFGEVVWLAVAQAIAVAVAAVTAGRAGAEVRRRVLARLRANDSIKLPDDLVRFQGLFTERYAQQRGSWMLLGAAIAVAILVATGVFALRTAAEGELMGIVFGSLALAICLGSFINAYFYENELAELIGASRKDMRREQRALRRLVRGRAIAKRARYVALGTSITEEYEQLGKAAKHRVNAMKYQIAQENPGVAGHGKTVAPKERPATLFDDFAGLRVVGEEPSL